MKDISIMLNKVIADITVDVEVLLAWVANKLGVVWVGL